jgi:hypothetical protein
MSNPRYGYSRYTNSLELNPLNVEGFLFRVYCIYTIMGKIIKLKESDLRNIIENVINEQSNGLEQDTQEFNSKVGEDLSPEEYKGIICQHTDDIELPSNLNDQDKQKVTELKERMKTASFSELMQLKKQIKQLKRQQQSEQVVAPSVVTLLGVSMNPGVAIVVGLVLFVLVLTFLGRLLKPRTTTYYCDGTKSRGLFGLLRR